MKNTTLITSNDVLEKAIKTMGSQSVLARAIGISQQNVSWWLNKSGVVPAEYVLPIEEATKSAGEMVTRHELRPDLYPMEEVA